MALTHDTDTDRLVALEAKVDLLTEQLAIVTEEALHQRRRRESLEELTADVMPLATAGIASISAELEAADVDLAELKGLVLHLVASAGRLEALLGQLDSLSELVADAGPLLKDVVGMATVRLAELEAKGYFGFVRQAGGIIDEIVTNYTEEDVAALGDNVVLILDTVRQMTQPEVMGLLSSTATAIHDDVEDAAEHPREAPSVFSLLGQMRDPEVRLGLQRAMNLLRTMSGTTDSTTEGDR